jgi:23S rRNA pseudouridine1911/1915/1917 synthase
MRHYTITSEDAKLRLDQYLAKVKPDLTRSFIQKLIKSGHVFVNNKKLTKPAYKISEDDELIVDIPSIKEIGVQAENIPLDIVYEDKDIVVVNKSAGMVVHPTDHGAHVSGTLVNAVLHHCKDLSGIGGEKRPGIVHRLDKNTSGLIIVAKNDKAHNHIAKQIHDRKVVKRYLTLLKGHLSPKQGSIEAPLVKTHGEKDVRVSGRKRAKYALTHYKVKKYVGDYSLVEVQIVTGRTHQIRVHFDSIGHPVCGDEMYGDKTLNSSLLTLNLKRQFLHAEYLKFRLPKNDEIIELSAPLAEDLDDVLKRLA